MKTNNLTFKTSKQIKGGRIEVDIRLNDECKNGHQDFAITGSIYEHPTSKAERYLAGCGCIHEDIEKHFPEFKTFINLHLCDYKGIPMHCVANGFYHLKSGFVSLGDKTQKQYFCDYYRVTALQYDTLVTSENQLEYAIHLKDLGVLSQWEKEANKAIKQLEELTGNDFDPDSERTQYNEPDPEAVAEFKKKKSEGYYTPEKKAERAKQKREEDINKHLAKISNACQEEVDKAENEKRVKTWMVKHLLKLNKKYAKQNRFTPDYNFNNWIHYTHTNTITFNWMDISAYHPHITEQEFDLFMDMLNQNDFDLLPSNISFELKGVKQFCNVA